MGSLLTRDRIRDKDELCHVHLWLVRLGLAQAADPLQLASQVGQAAMVWEFLVGFGEKKALAESEHRRISRARDVETCFVGNNRQKS